MHDNKLVKEQEEYKYVSCPLCDKNHFKIVFSQYLLDEETNIGFKFVIVQCMNCKLMYVNPLPVNNIFKAYTKINPYNYIRHEVKNRYNVFLEGIEKIDRLNKNREKWKVLDIGCATGFFLDICRTYGYDTKGIEASPEMSGWAQYLKLNIQNICEIPSSFKENDFDVCTMWDVLEHIENPKQTLKVIKKILRKDGFIFLRIPNSSFQISKAKILSKIYPKSNLIGFGEHVVHYNQRTIRLLLEELDFQVIEIFNGAIEIHNSPSRKLKLFKKIFFPLIIFLGNITKLNMGPALFVVAKNKKSVGKISIE